jgi:MFS family permease
VNRSTRLAHRTPFYYGWVVAGAVFVGMMISTTFAAPTFSLFIEPWTDEFGWSRTAISGAFSFATVLAALAGPLVGRAVDRWGGRFIIGGGGLLMAGALISMSFVTSLVMLYATFSVGRIAMMNVQNLAAHTVIANWFVRRRAFATAVAINGNRLGLAVWPLMVGGVFAFSGWRPAYLMLGGFATVLALVPMLLIVARRPEHVGLLPDGDRVPAGVAVDDSQVAEPRQWTPREALRTRAFWLLMLTHMGMMIAGGGLGVHRVPFFVGKGLSPALVGPLLVAVAAGMTAGGFAAAMASRRWEKRKIVAASMLGACAVMLAVLRVPATGFAVLIAFAEGLFFGGAFALIPVMLADYFGRSSIGTIRGLTHPVVVMANAFGPVFGGVVFDASGAYTGAFVTYAGVLVAGAAAAWFAIAPRAPVDSAAAAHAD